ncbi:MAG: PAS domain S-box protein [Halobacteriales archaeon]|nr:PAS domain S-box protein [Halobacteriales archaeon]
MTDPIRILHVDDDRDFAEMAAEFLERQDEQLTIEIATSASDGLDRLAEMDVDCIVSDYDMPDQNGLALLRAVRENYSDLPFVLFTGKGSEEIAAEAISAGVDDYQTKAGGRETYDLLANRIRNLVEQYRARARVRQRERRLSRVQEIADLGHFEWDIETDELDLSEQSYELLGVEPEEFDHTHEAWSELIHPEDRDTVEAAIDRALEGAGSYSIDFRVITPDGDIRHVHEEAEVEFDADGNPIRMTGAGLDITEREQHKRELRRERDRFQALFEQLHEPIVHGYIKDGDPIIQAVNPAFEEIFGYDEETLIGESLDEYIVPPDGEESATELNQRVTTDEEPVNVSIRRETTDGVRDFLFTNASVPGSENSEGFAIYTDITEQKQRERDLEQYETMVETIGDGVYTLDENLEFVMVNRGMVELTGYTKSELEGMHLAELLVGETDGIAPADYQHLLRDDYLAVVDIASAQTAREKLRTADPEIMTIDFPIVTAEDDIVPCEVRFNSLITDEGFVGTAGVFIDITDRRQREERLKRQNERLDQFASIVSHDLQNPLSVANGQLALAQEECESDRLAAVERAHDRMERLIEDLLTLAREGETVTEMTTVDFAAAIDESWQYIETADATLMNEADGTIRADPGRLQQLLSNLLRNAIEHNSETVTITIGETNDGLYIEDDGRGIPEDVRDRVFEPGYSTAEDGTGLGLNIVEQIVAAHGWTINIDESASGGTRFEITGIDRDR